MTGNTPNLDRVLYFDIDGTINDYEDVVKPCFRNGQLQQLLEELRFTRLVCVSGWATMARDAEAAQRWRRYPTSAVDLVETTRQVMADAFPNKAMFGNRCELLFENDNRCDHIDLACNWLYIDDWANEFAVKRWGATLPIEVRSRIHQCDPWGDGSDIIEFLNKAEPA